MPTVEGDFGTRCLGIVLRWHQGGHRLRLPSPASWEDLPMALTDITRPSDVALNTDLYELTQ